MSWLEEAKRLSAVSSSAEGRELYRALNIIERFIATTEEESCSRLERWAAMRTVPQGCGECPACRRRALVEEVRGG